MSGEASKNLIAYPGALDAPLFYLRGETMKMPIPWDWNGQDFCDFVVHWPNSNVWRIVLRGLLSNPGLEKFWDATTGDVEQVLELFLPALEQNLDELECLTMTIPVGTIWQFAGDTAPQNWMICDGSEISRSAYPDLFELIGEAYGDGDAATTFNIPDLRGRVAVGYKAGDEDFDSLGGIGGASRVELQLSEMPAHTHEQAPHNHGQNSHNHIQNPHNHPPFGTNIAYFQQPASPASGTVGYASGATMTTGPVPNATAVNQGTIATNIQTVALNALEGGDEKHLNLQPYQVVNFIIKVLP